MEENRTFELGDSLVELYSPVKVLNLDQTIYVCEGTWYEKDEDGEFQPDWSLTWFFTDLEHPEDYLYFEQDDPDAALHNFMRLYNGTASATSAAA